MFASGASERTKRSKYELNLVHILAASRIRWRHLWDRLFESLRLVYLEDVGEKQMFPKRLVVKRWAWIKSKRGQNLSVVRI
jgi:ribosome-interacting GTPase 1